MQFSHQSRSFLDRHPLALLAVCMIAMATSVFGEPCETITAAQIDAYLAARHSPLAGLGEQFVCAGSRYDVDPRLIVAIAQQESALGTVGVCPQYNNAFNWFYCISLKTCSADDTADVKCPLSSYTSWCRNVTGVTKFMDKTYFRKTLLTVSDIGQQYCKKRCGDWKANVAAIIRSLGGDPNALGFPCYPKVDDFERPHLGPRWTSTGIVGGACTIASSSDFVADPTASPGFCYYDQPVPTTDQYACAQVSGPVGSCEVSVCAGMGTNDTFCCSVLGGSDPYWSPYSFVNGLVNLQGGQDVLPIAPGGFIGIERDADGVTFHCYASPDGKTWTLLADDPSGATAFSRSGLSQPGHVGAGAFSDPSCGAGGFSLELWEGGSGRLPSHRACGCNC